MIYNGKVHKERRLESSFHFYISTCFIGIFIDERDTRGFIKNKLLIHDLDYMIKFAVRQLHLYIYSLEIIQKFQRPVVDFLLCSLNLHT